MKNFITLTFIFLLSSSTAIAEAKSELYPYTKELKVAPGAENSAEFGAFNIDEDIFASLNSKESNLRIIDGDGTEVPFLIRTKSGERKSTQYVHIPYDKLSFKELPDNRIEIELERDSDRKHRSSLASSVTITSKLRNFEKHVAVYSSDDRSEWKLLVERKPIFDYSRFIDIRNSRISFPPTDSKYLKLRISNITEKHESPYTRLRRTVESGKEVSATESLSFTQTDFKIDLITVTEKTEKLLKGKTVQQAYTSSGFFLSEDHKDKKTIIQFSTRKTPVTKVFLPTATVYFHRHFTVETSPDEERWRTVHSGIISRGSDDPDATDNQSIRLPRTIRDPFWRVSIQNNDSPPLAISGVELEGETHELVFYSDREKSYSIFYGAEDVPRPLYDIAHVLPRSDKSGICAFQAGEERDNPTFNTKTPRKALLSRRTIMTIAVILMIAVLAGVIVQVVKSVE